MRAVRGPAAATGACRYDGRVKTAGPGWCLAVGSLLTVAAGLGVPGCRAPTPEPITFQGRAVVVENVTADEWQNVEVWLNDHYRVTKSRMPPGERFNIPLSAFVAGFGQRYDAARQTIRGVEVTATAPGGRAVKFVWGTGRRR
jgi:hypothetical protein